MTGSKPLHDDGDARIEKHHRLSQIDHVIGRRETLRIWAVIAACFLIAFAALFARAMILEVNHDEQQFVAAGQLLAADSLLPYRDYPYFHTPVLVLIEAMLFEHTDHLLLAARTFSVLCAWLSLGVIFWIGYAAFESQPIRRRLMLSLGVSALLFINPTFTYTYFRAWNQSLPLLLILLALASQWLGARTGKARWFGVSGALVTLAIGTRLSFAPMALPFLVFAWFLPEAERMRRVKCTLFFCVGMTVGLVPSLAVIARAPEAFLFDNFVYNGSVNAAFRGTGANFWPALLGKVAFLAKVLIQPANLTLFATFIYLSARRGGPGERMSYLRRLVLGILLFAWLGALTATPSYTQYYFPVMALCVVGILAGFSEVPAGSRVFQRGQALLVIALGVGAVTATIDYRHLVYLGHTAAWIPMKTHAEALMVRSLVSRGPLLTFAPIVPMEAGLDIYPSLATGPFAWRTARFLSPAQRSRYHFVGEGELGGMLEDRPPAAILTGYERKLEAPFIDYAVKHGYRPIKLLEKKKLWIMPIVSEKISP